LNSLRELHDDLSVNASSLEYWGTAVLLGVASALVSRFIEWLIEVLF